MSSPLDMVPYLLALGAAALGVLSLSKDWHNYNPRLRKAAAVVLCLVATLTLIRQYKDDKDRIIQKEKQAEVGKRLEGQVVAANDAQKANTALFLDSFSRLSQKVSDLQTQAATGELQKKLANVQRELKATENALAPGPKARLLLTFKPFDDPPADSGSPPTPTTKTTLSVDTDGTIHLPFAVLNDTKVTATDGEVRLIICDGCKYAKEPSQFEKMSDSRETERLLAFRRILPFTWLDLSVDIVVPQGVNFTQLAISYRCQTCVFSTALLRGDIHLLRPFVRPLVVIPRKTSGR